MDKENYLKIARPQNSCIACGAPLLEAGKHPSAIFEHVMAEGEQDEAGPDRQDYCSACWDGKRREQDYFSFWLARREKPKAKKSGTRKQRNATLLSYFDYLVQKNDPEYAQHLFFLSHLLMKFSVLKWVRSEPGEEGAPTRIVFRNTVTDDFISVDEVPLQDERIATIKKEIDEYLSRIEDDSEPVAEQG